MARAKSPKITRSIKLIMSLLIFICDYVLEGIHRVIGKKRPGKYTVLYYHAVTSDQRNHFARQMDDLIRWAKPVSAGIKEPLEDGFRRVAVTFDDGFMSVLENALPVLAQRKIPSTIFVPTGNVGQHPKWIKDKKGPLAGEVVITFDQLSRLKNNELVSIGSHGVTHSNLLLLKEAEVRVELSESRRVLAATLERDIKLLSFPHGAYNQKIVELAREAGYDRVFTILPKLGFSDPCEYVTGRVRVDPTDWRLEFRLKLLGAYCWLSLSSALKCYIHRLMGKLPVIRKEYCCDSIMKSNRF
ncbi:MAG: polysaccharide deacetylase family protein [Candidatus Aenigmarchaeota archaeon]|nr:polysaccharide deacetylase family protein [Candidatus Aenigmarchaeota archaeon]